MQFIASPNYWAGRAGYRPRYLILHGTAGGSSAEAIAAWFANPESGVSAHYVIDQAGDVICCVQEGDTAWANGVITGEPATLPFRTAGDGVHRDAWWSDAVNPNYLTISIEHVKPHDDNSDQITAAQQAASFALIKVLCDQWGIPKRFADSAGGITGHFSIDPLNRSHCPGPYPWSDLWNFLAGGDDMLSINDPFAAKYFTQQSPTSWHCTATGCDVHDAILGYYQRIQGAVRLPRTNEIYDPSGLVYQVFEAGVLCYDPAGKFDNPGLGSVYAMHLDENTPGLAQLMKLAGIAPAPITAGAANAVVSDLEAIQKAAQDALQQLGASSSS